MKVVTMLIGVLAGLALVAMGGYGYRYWEINGAVCTVIALVGAIVVIGSVCSHCEDCECCCEEEEDDDEEYEDEEDDDR